MEFSTSYPEATKSNNNVRLDLSPDQVVGFSIERSTGRFFWYNNETIRSMRKEIPREVIEAFLKHTRTLLDENPAPPEEEVRLDLLHELFQGDIRVRHSGTLRWGRIGQPEDLENREHVREILDWLEEDEDCHGTTTEEVLQASGGLFRLETGKPFILPILKKES